MEGSPVTSSQASRTVRVPSELSGGAGPVASLSPSLASILPLRLLNTDYSSSGGVERQDVQFQEYSRSAQEDTFAPMRRFSNGIGHVSERATAMFPPSFHLSPVQMIRVMKDWISLSVSHGFMWHPTSIVHSSLHGDVWRVGREGAVTSGLLSSILTDMMTLLPPPLSFHTWHAYHEQFRDLTRVGPGYVYLALQETTRVQGIIGTLHVNSVVDMATEDDGDIPNAEARAPLPQHAGFLCAGHSAHSYEAGRVRRLVTDAKVRLMGNDLIHSLDNIIESISTSHTDASAGMWRIYSMGSYSTCTRSFVESLISAVYDAARHTWHVPTVHVSCEARLVVLSCSTGVVMVKSTSGSYVDTTSVYECTYTDFPHLRPVLSDPRDVRTSLRSYFSSFFLTVPYVMSDRPPRTLMSSVQSIQAVCSPYGSGTSAMVPTVIQKPLTTTELILNARREGAGWGSDLMPGVECLTLILNTNENYEDCIMVNKGVVDRGMFSVMALSRFSLPPDDVDQSAGDEVTDKTGWWKSHDLRRRGGGSEVAATAGTPISIPKHNRKLRSDPDGRGTVVDVTDTHAGNTLVKTLRYSCMTDGDKLITGHGQKGVVKVTPTVDMPVILTSNDEIIPDVVMSMSSITNRMTNGQYYELVTSLVACGGMRNGDVVDEQGTPVWSDEYNWVEGCILVLPGDKHSLHTECEVMDGTSGDVLPCRASWGFCRFMQMTQVTWDKQHYTHKIATQGMVNPRVGRSRGGALRFGHMEINALAASGMGGALLEAMDRSDMVLACVCTGCKRLGQLCTCEVEGTFTQVALPHSLIVFDCASAVVFSTSNVYEIS